MPNVQLAGRGCERAEGCRIFKLRGDPSRKLDEGDGGKLGIADGLSLSLSLSLAGSLKSIGPVRGPRAFCILPARSSA